MRYVTKYLVLTIFVWSIFNGSFAFCADLNAELLDAVKDGNIETLQTLLEKGADVNAKDEYNTTALMWASQKSYAEVVQALLAKGVYDVTAPEWVSEKSYDERVQVLLQTLLVNGADVNAKDNGGMTALMYASQRGRPEVVQTLLVNGADVNVKTNDDWTTLRLAKERGSSEVVQLLINSGAKE